MIENIWNGDLDKIYENNEDNNTLGGYFPIGETGAWHSGIHIYNEAIMPYLRGELVAYRLNDNFVTVDKKTEIKDCEFQLLTKEEQSYYPKFSDNFLKKKAKVRIQEPKKQDQISNNFFIIKHSFFDNKLEFYSLYNNIIPDNEYYKDFLEYKKYDSSFLNKRLFFYRTWQYKYELDSSCKEESVIMGKKIFKGSKITSCKLATQDSDYNTFRNKYKSQNLDFLECKTEDESNFDSNFTIQSKLVDIKSFKVIFENSDLILQEKDLIFDRNRKYNKLFTYTTNTEEDYNQDQLEKDDFLITKNGKEEFGIKQNSEYTGTEVLIPCTALSTEFQKYDNIYSRRTDKDPDGEIYRVSDIENISINETNCPLYYEDITKDDSLLFHNGIVRLSGDKLLHLFSLSKKNKIITICRNDDINEVITKFDIIDSDESNIQKLDISEKDYIFLYKNDNWSKQNILFFIDGKYHEPIEISSINDSELKSNLNELLSKNENEIFENLPPINSNISIFKTEPIAVYKNDSYKEMISVYDENQSYKKIKNNGHYAFFNLYIQNLTDRTYKIENNIKITSLSGYIKKNVNKTYSIHGKLLYSNLDNKEPKIFLDSDLYSDFEFTSDELPNETTGSINKILYNNKFYSLKNISFELLSIKIDDKENYKLIRNGEIQYPNIEINSNFILGEPYTEYKYISDKPFYDIAVLLKKNYLEDSELQKMDKKYYIYSELLKNETVYKNQTNPTHSFFIPQESKIASVYYHQEGTERSYSLKFDYIAIYLKDTDLKFSYDKVTFIKDFKLNYVFVDSKKTITLDKKSNLQILTDYFIKAGGKKIKTDFVDKNYCKIYLTKKEINIPAKMFVIGDSLIKKNEIITEGNQRLFTSSSDYDDFMFYNCDPRYSHYADIKSTRLFIPKGTVFEILEYLPETSCVGYIVKILSIPVYISKKGVKMQCIIPKKPSKSIILCCTPRIYTEETKNNDEIAKHFYENIDSIIGEEYDYGNIVVKDGRYNVFIPAEKLKIDQTWYFKEKTIYEKYIKTKITGNETFNLFENNPLYLNITSLKLDNNYKIQSIDEKQSMKAYARSRIKYCPVYTEKETFYIQLDSIERYRENAFNLKKFFVNCEKESDDDFLCDLKTFSKNFDLDTDEKNALNLIFNNKNIQNDLQMLYHTPSKTNNDIKTIFRHSVVTHLHELDEKAYEKIAEDPDIKYIKDRCKKEEICNAIASNNEFNFIKKQNGLITFVHPVYFLNHLKEANIFEINPYEGKTYAQIYNYKKEQREPLYDKSEYESKKVLSNPGMAVKYTSDKCWGLNIDGYSGLNGFFNANYINEHRDYKEYWHEGVDFQGKAGSSVVSLIYGKISKCGKRPNGEGFILMQSLTYENLFFLALHIDPNSISVIQNEDVFPGKELGKTLYMENKKGSEISHLHVSVIKMPNGKTYGDVIIDGNNNLIAWGSTTTPNQPIWDNMINPFNYSDENTWKGRYK